MPHPRGHSLILTVLLLLLTAGGVLIWWQNHLNRQATIAQVGTTPIARSQLALALRNHVWRHNLHWQTLASPRQDAERQIVLDQLIHSHLLAQLPSAEETRAQTEADQRFQQFTKQFEGANTWQTRAATQNLDEILLRQQLLHEARLSISIENHLANHPDQPTEAEARAYFAEHSGHFTVPESARASHLFLTIHDKERPNAESNIRAYHQQLITNLATLPNLATRYSDDPRTKKTRGELDWFSRDRVPPDFASNVFALTPGQLSPPFITDLGWHIVKLHEKRPARPATFDEVKPEILAHLHTQFRRTALQTWLTQQRQNAAIQIHPDRLNTLQPAPYQ
ncbi:hypothetical protein FEM03_07650 [Phragmitibacter flavus]|uniref:PpiC domain-containing protein n=1 Tax=Phragmitibacter flavus TaxID=2576071 RepID=A0A5R8KGH0_9BACT|nr:peptidylprolyl isomerase [Phragmitibacter flavus]TLD71394.1 hypothetical protein FEM03_07650 [Phragmitibacter flavus]